MEYTYASNTVEVSAPSPTAVPSESSPSPEAQTALTFISQREQLPIDTLVIVNDYPRPIPLLGRSFQAVTILDTKSGTFFPLLVDRDTRQVKDWKDIQTARNQAYAGKYGKLQPDLYEELQKIGESDVLTVTIVLAAGSGQSFTDRYATASAVLAAKYPEVREAMQRSGIPMDVADPKLADQIRKEYRQLMIANPTQRTGPVAQWLKAQGYAAKTIGRLPALTAVPPKRVIEELAQRDDVGTIFLAEARMVNW